MTGSSSRQTCLPCIGLLQNQAQKKPEHAEYMQLYMTCRAHYVPVHTSTHRQVCHTVVRTSPCHKAHVLHVYSQLYAAAILQNNQLIVVHATFCQTADHTYTFSSSSDHSWKHSTWLVRSVKCGNKPHAHHSTAWQLWLHQNHCMHAYMAIKHKVLTCGVTPEHDRTGRMTTLVMAMASMP